jgi:hypothetical protein
MLDPLQTVTDPDNYRKVSPGCADAAAWLLIALATLLWLAGSFL